MASLNPIAWLKNLFRDFLLRVSGTWIGAPKDPPWSESDWKN
jgi:hypothetical protein